jgi:hypothetical protein
MADLARVKTFVTGDELTATQANDIQDLLIDLLTGAVTGINVVLRYDNSDAATLAIDNTGGGVVLDAQVGGVQKALINASGQIESTVATGTPPLVIASTTLVPNLHVATAANGTALGGSASSAYALKTYVDAKVYAWSHTWYIDQPNLGGTFDTEYAFMGIICPSGATYTIDRVRYLFQSGTVTGNSTVKIKHFNSSSSLQNTFTITLDSGDTALNVYDANLSDVDMADGDYLVLATGGTDNGHREITLQIEGTETVV